MQIQTIPLPADISTCQFVLMPGNDYKAALQAAQTAAPTTSTVTQLQIKVEELNPERIQDMMEMFWLFVLALIGVWGSKQLLNLFSTDSDKD